MKINSDSSKMGNIQTSVALNVAFFYCVCEDLTFSVCVCV